MENRYEKSLNKLMEFDGIEGTYVINKILKFL